ncbi:Septin-domain-containing protein [Powellomyces hirtus]|nr:Septin-domain-containing protein [Powellomyces hirtus]
MGDDKTGSRYTAISNYEPVYADEIRLDTGDLVVILQAYDDGWVTGHNVTKDTKGLLPFNFLAPAKEQSKSPQSQPQQQQQQQPKQLPQQPTPQQQQQQLPQSQQQQKKLNPTTGAVSPAVAEDDVSLNPKKMQRMSSLTNTKVAYQQDEPRDGEPRSFKSGENSSVYSRPGTTTTTTTNNNNNNLKVNNPTDGQRRPESAVEDRSKEYEARKAFGTGSLPLPGHKPHQPSQPAPAVPAVPDKFSNNFRDENGAVGNAAKKERSPSVTSFVHAVMAASRDPEILTKEAMEERAAAARKKMQQLIADRTARARPAAAIGVLKFAIVGDSGIGKTSLIRQFMASPEVTQFEPAGTSEYGTELFLASTLTHPSTSPSADHFNLQFVDTPGFGAQMDAMATIKPVVEYHLQQFTATDRVFVHDMDARTLHRFLTTPNGAHTHVDILVFGILHRVKPVDIEYMKRLAPYVAICPVILKADTMSQQELFRLKMSVLEEVKRAGIDIYTFGMELDECIDLARAGVPGAVPFAVSNPVTSDRYGSSASSDSNSADRINEFKALKTRILQWHVSDIRAITAAKFVQWREVNLENSTRIRMEQDRAAAEERSRAAARAAAQAMAQAQMDQLQQHHQHQHQQHQQQQREQQYQQQQQQQYQYPQQQYNTQTKHSAPSAPKFLTNLFARKASNASSLNQQQSTASPPGTPSLTRNRRPSEEPLHNENPYAGTTKWAGGNRG